MKQSLSGTLFLLALLLGSSAEGSMKTDASPLTIAMMSFGAIAALLMALWIQERRSL